MVISKQCTVQCETEKERRSERSLFAFLSGEPFEFCRQRSNQLRQPGCFWQSHFETDLNSEQLSTFSAAASLFAQIQVRLINEPTS